MRSPSRLIILNTPPRQIAMSLDPPVLNGMTIADRNIAIRYLARVLMEAAGANPEEISDDKC